MSDKQQPVENFAMLGLSNKYSLRYSSPTKKPYFKEKELLSKAIQMNLGNNRMIEHSKEQPQYYWRVCREDILKQYKLQSELATMRENANKSCETVVSMKPHRSDKSQVNKSVNITTIPSKSHTHKVVSTGKTAELPSIVTQSVVHNQKSITQDLQYNKLVKERSNVLLRFSGETATGNDKKISKPKYGSTIRTRENLSIPTNQQAWRSWMHNNTKKEYTSVTESASCVNDMPDTMRPSNPTLASSAYNPINSSCNPQLTKQGVFKLIETEPNILKRKCTSITRRSEENWNKDYQFIIQRHPRVFHRNGQLCWNEAVCRKSYANILRSGY